MPTKAAVAIAFQAAVALATAGPLAAQDSAGVRADRVERSLLPTTRVHGRHYSPATIIERMRTYNVPAVSVAVIDGGRIAWARAYGWADVENQRAATTTTIFQAASMSKPVTAVAALQLVESGSLSLDSSVNASLHSWMLPMTELSAKHPVTLRQLLTHTAGLTVHGFPGYAPGVTLPTVPQLLDGLPPANSPAVRVEATPGTAWNYSGGGFMIVQVLLTDVTREPFPDLLKRHVIDPIGMRNSAFEHPLTEAHRGSAALGYLANDSLVPGGFHVHPELAAAGLWTTPSDLANWILAMQAAVRGDPGALLTPGMAQAMMTPGLGGWGLGVQIRGSGDTAIFTHGGANVGYRAAFYGFVHRPSGVVVMTNSDAGGALVEEVAHAVAAEYGWSGFAPHVVIPAHLEPAIVREWAGTYAQGPVRAIITIDDDMAHIRLPGGQLPTTDPLEIIPLARDRFTTADGALTARIIRDASGGIESINVAGTVLKRIP